MSYVNVLEEEEWRNKKPPLPKREKGVLNYY